jgi:prepilin-type N-terminal cleavage/methylation domain-containing protein
MLPTSLKLGVNKQKGFTLIEMLVVLGILAVLLTIVLIAVNPAAQMMSARNTKRNADVNQILNAVDQYFIVHGSMPTGITTSTKTITSTVGAGNIDICTELVDEFIAALPNDPTGGSYTNCASYDTGYTIQQSSGGNNRITVSAPSAESATISVTR